MSKLSTIIRLMMIELWSIEHITNTQYVPQLSTYVSQYD